MAKKKVKKKRRAVRTRSAPTKRKTQARTRRSAKSTRKSRTIGVIALILNLIIPGLGSLVGGRYKAGTWQIILTAIAWITVFTPALIIISFVAYIIALVWGIVTSIRILL